MLATFTWWFLPLLFLIIFFIYKEIIIISIKTTHVKPISAFHLWNFASRGETSYRNYCFIYSLLKNLSFFLANKRLHNGSAYWLATSPPAARAYHSMTSIGSRHLLIGGFDGKSTFGNLWWLVPEGTGLLWNT